jgi:hypothetical protein
LPPFIGRHSKPKSRNLFRETGRQTKRNETETDARRGSPACPQLETKPRRGSPTCPQLETKPKRGLVLPRVVSPSIRKTEMCSGIYKRNETKRYRNGRNAHFAKPKRNTKQLQCPLRETETKHKTSPMPTLLPPRETKRND